jgi:hypothetical protein
VRELQPGAGGAFSTSFSQTEGYSYRAHAAGEQIRTSSVSVTVRPLLRISVRPRRARAGTKLTVVGRVVPTGAASSADLEVFDRRRNSWRNVDSRPVRAGKVTLSWIVQPGPWRLRVAVRRGSTSAGYEAANSAPVRVFGVAPR